MAGGAAVDKDPSLKQLEEETDAFFDQLLSDSGVGTNAAVTSPTSTSLPADSATGTASSLARAEAAATDTRESLPETIERDAEFVQLSRQLCTSAPAEAKAKAAAAPELGPAVQTFDLADDDEECEELAPEAPRGPMVEAPPAPDNFGSEDLALREELICFYQRWKPQNLPNVNLIVAKFHGRDVSNLWAQLSIKYQLPAVEAVELLTRTLYMSSLFEYPDEEHAALIAEVLSELLQQGLAAEATSGSSRAAQMLHGAIQRGASDGNDAAVRALCFRGIPEESGLRPLLWKVLLGYLPMARHAEWNAIHAEKRALYASYKGDFVSVTQEDKVQVKVGMLSRAALHEAEDLLQEIQNDVERTRQDFGFFRKPATRASLLTLLFVYARLNPGVRYVQGMNEVAAVVFWVMSDELETAEADAFWVFSELMVEIKEGFMEALDHTDEGVHALTDGVTRLLRSYDPQVARHLQKSELPPFVFIFRWCTVLFSQDATLPDVARLWDSFLADPNRFEFVMHTCVALVLGRRDELLDSGQQFALAEVLQAAPRSSDSEQLLRRACAICSFERRTQVPPFPPKARPQVVEDLSEWAQSAAITAQELGAEVSKTIQENIAPVVSEKASQVSAAAAERAAQVSAAAAVAAADSAQALQSWLEETAPARREALEQAQAHVSSLWDSVRSGTQRLTAEYSQKESVEHATSSLSAAADTAAATASSLFARAAAAFAAPSPPISAPASAAAASSATTAPAASAAAATATAAATTSLPVRTVAADAAATA